MINIKYGHINTTNSFINVKRVHICMIYSYMRQNLKEKRRKLYFKGQKENTNC